MVALVPNELCRQPVGLSSSARRTVRTSCLYLASEISGAVCLWMPFVSAAVLSQLKQFLPRMQQANAELQQKLQVRQQIVAVAAAVAPITASSSDIHIRVRSAVCSP